MSLRPLVLLPLLLVFASPAAAAEGRVDLVLVTAQDFPRLETRNWFQLFAELKTAVQIRGARAGDKVQIVTSGVKSAPRYRVTGLLNERNVLVLPGGKFTLRDGAKIADYLNQLKKSGPPGERKITAFGLTAEQFEALQKDLAQPITFSTKGKPRAEVLEKIAEDLSHSVGLGRGARDAMSVAGDLADELRGITRGTALAYMLRPAGLGLMPRRLEGGKVRLEVHAGLKEKQAWPLGLPAQKERRKLLPGLFEFLSIEMQKDVNLLDYLQVISEKLKAPILLDHNALAELDVDLSKATVSINRQRTTPSLLLSRVVRAAHPRLLTEVRIDERNKPFIYVTVFRVRK